MNFKCERCHSDFEQQNIEKIKSYEEGYAKLCDLCSSKKRPLTELEKGVFVYIDESQHDLLKKKTGYMAREFYSEQYKEIAVENEIGRFLIFRLLSM